MSATTRRKASRRNRASRATARERGPWPSALLIAIAGLAVFGHTVLNQFVDWDDNRLIVTNPYLIPLTFPSLARLWARPFAEVYNPLVYTAYALEIALFGLRPFIFHAANVLLHTASALLLWRSLTILLPKSRWAPAAGALVFAVHPLQAEAVSWATGQKEVLSGFLCLAALWMYLRAREGGASPAGDGCSSRSAPPSRADAAVHSAPAPASAAARVSPGSAHPIRLSWLAGGFVCFLLALLSKPSVAPWPFALLALEVLYLREKPRAAMIRLAPWIVAGVAALALTSRVQPPTAGLRASYPGGFARPLLAADSLAFYTTKVLLPTGLAPVYAKRPLQAAASWRSVVKLAVLGTALLLLLRRRTLWSASAAIFVVMLLPVLGFVPFMYQLYSTVADRYVYVAMIGPALAIAGVITLAEQRKIAFLGGGVAVWLIFLGALAARQGAFWRTSETLWVRAARVSPASSVVHGSMANLHVAAGRRDEAMRELDRALSLDPKYSIGILNRALLLAADGKTAEAERELLRATAFEETAAAAWNSLGNLRSKDDPEEAISAFREALRRNPDLSDVRLKIAGLYWGQNRFDECESELVAALKSTPSSADAHAHLGTLRVRQGRVAEARAEFEQALRLNPNQAEALVGLEGLEGQWRQGSPQGAPTRVGTPGDQ